MKFLLIATMLAAAVTTASASDAPFKLPPELLLALPVDGMVKAEWMIPPIATEKVRAAGLTGQRFRLDRQGATWMLHGKENLTDLNSGHAFSVTKPLDDFIWLDNGALILAGDSALGIIPPLKAQGAPPEMPRVPFQPVIELPVRQSLLATDGKDVILVFGYDSNTRGYALYELLNGGAGWHKLFVAADKIADACVDGQTLYVAADRTVYRINFGDGASSAIFVHPAEAITGLACVGGAGPFYVTAKGVGVAFKGGLEFIRSNRTQIQARNGALYLFMPESLGVMRLDNVRRMFGPK